MQGLEQALAEFMASRQAWEGTASELLSILEGEDLPDSPKGLSHCLRERPIAGIEIEFHRTKAARVLKIRRVTQKVTQVSQIGDAKGDANTTPSGEAILIQETPIESPTETPRTFQQAPHVDCHDCRHYQGRDNPDYLERSCAVKQWHFPCYGWRPCSKFVEAKA